MSLFDKVFDPKNVERYDWVNSKSPLKAQFVFYMNKRIYWDALEYIRKNITHNKKVESLDRVDYVCVGPQSKSVIDEDIERIDIMVSIEKEFRNLKKIEQRVFICLYQLDWNMTKTARILGCSESYVCRVNRSLIEKLGLSLKGSAEYGQL